jgi:hypothetical protein
MIYEYEVPGGALNISSTKLPRPWSPWESSPSRKNPHGRTGNRTRDLMISSQNLCPLDHELAGHSFQSNILLLGFFYFRWLTEYLGAFSLLPCMLHAPKLYNPDSIIEVTPTLTLQSHVHLQRRYVLSHWTSTELKLYDVIKRCNGRDSNPADPSVKQARSPYCSMFSVLTARTEILRKIAVNDPRQLNLAQQSPRGRFVVLERDR